MTDPADRPTEPTRVLIADDQQVVRMGLRLVLEQLGFEVVAEATTGREAVALAAEHRPDVCLLDIRMPEMDGLRATAEIAGSAAVPIPVVILTTFDADEYLDEAIANGASGFVLKDAGPALIAEAIRAAVRGDALIDPSMTIRYLRRRAAPADGPAAAPPRELASLSDRELDVVRAIAVGRTNEEIGAELFVSLSTVKSHVTSILTKLGVRNRVEIAAWAWRHHLVPPSP